MYAGALPEETEAQNYFWQQNTINPYLLVFLMANSI